MALTFQVLGRPGRDNALWVRIDTGQGFHRFLFDCGEGCARGVERSELMELDHLCFSHFHLDHVAGFDGLFRRIYNRPNPPIHVWGPKRTVDLMECRFQSFWWNLHQGQGGEWEVRDLLEKGMGNGGRFETTRAFARDDLSGVERAEGGVIWDEPAFCLASVILEHHGPCVGYVLREKARQHIRAERLADLGLRAGPWLRELKEGNDVSVEAGDGRIFSQEELRDELIVKEEGDSIAYLTDFLPDEAAFSKLVPFLQGVRTLVCESQYRHADWELAKKHCHGTARRTGELAAQAGVKRLILMHLSDRYSDRDWKGMLKEARRFFPETRFPSHWDL
ncbi:MAG: MBL fold metallo-hydrolase [Verrucomicrobiota bacterium]